MKYKIMWIIDSIEIGGAEMLLRNLLPSLKEVYEIHLVVLSKKSDFNKDEFSPYVENLIFVERAKKYSFFKQYLALKKLVKEINPDIVRSQLSYSNILARLITPCKVKCFFSVHSILSLDSFSNNIILLYIEKFVYKKRHKLIAVSNEVLLDYDKTVGLKGNSFVLKNFVSPLFLNHSKKTFNTKIKKIVCVGNIKRVKNYQLIIDAFIDNEELRENFIIDIYGDGSLRENLQNQINFNNLPITFKGKSKEIFKLLKDYDAYLLPSFHEGFGIAVAEAMMVGLPVIASDLDVIKDTTQNNALYFNPLEKGALINTLIQIKNFNALELNLFHERATKAHKIAVAQYSIDAYLERLQVIYNS